MSHEMNASLLSPGAFLLICSALYMGKTRSDSVSNKANPL